MTEVAGFLPPTWETWIEFPAPALAPEPLWVLRVLTNKWKLSKKKLKNKAQSIFLTQLFPKHF